MRPPPPPGENFLFPLANSRAICRSKFRQETRDYDLFPSRETNDEINLSPIIIYICVYFIQKGTSIETNSVEKRQNVVNALFEMWNEDAEKKGW